MMKWPLIVLLPAAMVLAGCDFELDGTQVQSDFHYSYPMPPGGHLEVDNFNGSINIDSWDQNTVDISGVKYAGTEAVRDAIRIETAQSGGTVSVRTVRPIDFHGSMGARYVIRVPRNISLNRIVSSNGAVRITDINGPAHIHTSNGSVNVTRLVGVLDAITSNGAIEAEDITGNATLHTSNGHITANGIKGMLEASSSNGGINAHLASVNDVVKCSTSNSSIDLTVDSAPHSDIRANTSNGAITLHLPAAIDARVQASTSNSGIDSDFDVSVHGPINKHHLEGSIGSGGPLLDLESSNGHIRLLKL